MTRRGFLRFLPLLPALPAMVRQVVMGGGVAAKDHLGLPIGAWRIIERFGGVVFRRYEEVTSRRMGFLGWIENRHGVVVGWIDRQGRIFRSIWLESGRGYNVARDMGIQMRKVGEVRF